MNIPQVDITHQNGEIEITTQRARMDITTQRPQLRLIRNAPRMNVDRRLPQMHIDRSQAQALIGNAPILQINRQYYETTREQAVSNIGNVASEGTQMMQIENPGSTLADLAAQESDSDLGELTASAMPPPQIDWENGYLNIDWTPGSMQMEWDVNSMVDIRVEPYSVEVRLSKYPDIKITVKYRNGNPVSGGKFVDQYL